MSAAGISAALLGAGVSRTVAVPLALVFAVGLIGYAMFVNAPVEDGTPTSPTASQDTPQYSAD